MTYHHSRQLNLPFGEVIEKLIRNLKLQGFDIITTIDLKDSLKAKPNLKISNCKIFSACSPELAYKAVTLESHIGVMLPCNIIVQEHENGEVELSATNSMETLDNVLDTTELTEIARDISARLRSVVGDLHGSAPHRVSASNNENQYPQILD